MGPRLGKPKVRNRANDFSNGTRARTRSQPGALSLQSINCPLWEAILALGQTNEQAGETTGHPQPELAGIACLHARTNALEGSAEDEATAEGAPWGPHAKVLGEQAE